MGSKQQGISFGYQRSDELTEAIQLPGVGSYDVNQSFQSLAIKPTSIAGNFTQSKRFAEHKREIKLPGPGNYQWKSFLDIKLPTSKKDVNNRQDQEVSESASNFSIQRRLIKHQSKTPQTNSQVGSLNFNILQYGNKLGPGQYNLDSSFNSEQIKGIEFSKYSTRDQHNIIQRKKMESTPSVGTYQIDKAYRSSESFIIGKAEKKSFFDNTNTQTPGPNKYFQDGIKQSSKGVRIGKAERKIQLGLNSISPGPAFYRSQDAFPQTVKSITSQITIKNRFTSPVNRYDISPEMKNIQHGNLSNSIKPITFSKSQRPFIGKIDSIPGTGAYSLPDLFSPKEQWINSKKDRGYNMKPVFLSQKKNQDYENQIRQKQQQQQQLTGITNMDQGQLIRKINKKIGKKYASMANLPGPGHYDGQRADVTHVVKFAEGSRKNQFLDVFNHPGKIQRSPGPAIYSLKPGQREIGVKFSSSQKKSLFQGNKLPGVGNYNIDKSEFQKYANAQNSPQKAKKKKIRITTSGQYDMDHYNF